MKGFGPIPEIGLGIYFTATVSAGSYTSTDHRLQNNDWPSERFHGWYFYNDPTAQDEVRQIDSATWASGTGTFTTHLASMTTGSSKSCEKSFIDPQEMNRIIALAMRYIYADYTTLLSIGFADHDQATSGAASWTGSAGTTLTKITAAGNVPEYHYQSQRVQNNSANDYSESAAMLLPPNTTYLLTAYSRAVAGTNILRLQGPSASVDSISHDEASFMIHHKQVQTGSTGGSHTVRLENDSATGDAYWGAASLLPSGWQTIPLPSWVSNRERLRGLSRGVLTGYSVDNCYDARGMRLETLKQTEWRYANTPFGANPHAVEVYVGGGPMFITGSRPHSDFESFSTDASTTTAEQNQILTVCKWLLGKKWPDMFPGLEKKYAAEVASYAADRTTDLPDINETVSAWRGR